MTTEELLQGWNNKSLTPDQQVEALVRVFGMPRDRAEYEVNMLWKDEVPGAYSTQDE